MEEGFRGKRAGLDEIRHVGGCRHAREGERAGNRSLGARAVRAWCSEQDMPSLRIACSRVVLELLELGSEIR